MLPDVVGEASQGSADIDMAGAIDKFATFGMGQVRKLTYQAGRAIHANGDLAQCIVADCFILAAQRGLRLRLEAGIGRAQFMCGEGGEIPLALAGGTDAAINYLLYAFRVLGGFADPKGRGMQREYAELEIKSTPYRDMIAKEYPIIAKMQRNECTFEDLDEEDMVIIGDVDHCICKVERYRDAGLDHLLSLVQADRIPHDKVMRSIELFAKEIMPRFR